MRGHNKIFEDDKWNDYLAVVLESRSNLRTPDKWIIFVYFSVKTNVVTSKICLGEMVLERDPNICFYGEIPKIIPELSLLLLLIWSTNFSGAQ